MNMKTALRCALLAILLAGPLLGATGCILVVNVKGDPTVHSHDPDADAVWDQPDWDENEDENDDDDR